MKNTNTIKLTYLSLRNLKRHKNRVIQCILAVLMSVFIINILFGMISGFENELKTNVTKYIAGDLRIRDEQYHKFRLFNPYHLVIQDTSKTINTLKKLPHIKAVSAKLMMSVSLVQGENFESFHLVGMNFENEKKYQNIDDFLVDGTFPQANKKEAVIGTDLSKNYGFKIGDSFTLLGNTIKRVNNAMTFTVVGIIEYPLPVLNKINIYVPLTSAQRFSKAPNASSEIHVQGEKISPENLKIQVEKTLADIKTQQFEVNTWNKISIFTSAFKLARVIYLFIAGIFFFLSGLVVYNTVTITVQERMYEMGVLSAMGFTNKQLVKIIRRENIIIVTLGSICGLILSMILITILHKTGIDLSSVKDYGENAPISGILYPQVSAFWTILVVAYALVAINLIAQLPLRKIAKLNVMQALRTIK